MVLVLAYTAGLQFHLSEGKASFSLQRALSVENLSLLGTFDGAPRPRPGAVEAMAKACHS